MKVVIDIEGDSLNPTQIWVIVCKNIDTGEYHIFRNPGDNDDGAAHRFHQFAGMVDHWIGHNILGFDMPVLSRLLGIQYSPDNCTDTLIISKLVDYSRKKHGTKKGPHSLEDYGLEFGTEKGSFNDWSKYSEDLEKYCCRDVDIAHRIYAKYLRVIVGEEWQPAIRLEHSFQHCVNSLTRNGFAFDRLNAVKLLDKITGELGVLDGEILRAFPPREVLIREFTPRATKFGTISKQSVPKPLWDDISSYEVGRTYSLTRWEEFNPASHPQLIRVLAEAGWQPVNKTDTHKDTERELNKLKFGRRHKTEADLAAEKALEEKLEKLKISGWSIDEENLATLPISAPQGARLLAKRTLLESRRRSLVEWLGLVKDDGRIHGEFQGIGAWTHRMSHQKPNTANIPTEFEMDGTKKIYGAELRKLWIAPKKRLLVGVDAEGIQLRIFAHYIDDKDFTNALVNGRKSDKTDPHSFNQKVLGDLCKTRQAAKRFVFALLLGAGMGKLAQILECSVAGAEEALDRLLDRYEGFARLKQTSIPTDAERGYFVGLDGRKVRIPGDTASYRRHLCMSGYLQNGEAVVMKKACLKWEHKLKDFKSILVDFVHDEWQTETPNNMEIALQVAKMQASSLKEVGDELKLKCPLAGSYWNDDHNDYTVGTNWLHTH